MTSNNDKKSYYNIILTALLSIIGILLAANVTVNYNQSVENAKFITKMNEYIVTNSIEHTEIKGELFVTNQKIEHNNQCLENIDCKKLNELINGVPDIVNTVHNTVYPYQNNYFEDYADENFNTYRENNLVLLN